MSSTIGDKIKISVFGESHGKAIGVVIDGLPSGLKLDMDKILLEMKRRAPGNDKTATPRKEADFPEILSGVVDNTITGAPLCAIIYNTNTKSKDYSNIKRCPRPGHSDYPAYVKYNGFNDIAGGGHFSGRITAPIVFAGAVCKQILLEKGIKVTAHINSIGNVEDKSFDPCNISDETIENLLNSSFPLLDSSKEEEMRKEVADSAFNKDSVGGTIECAVVGMKAGIGYPMFDGIEGKIAKAVFGIPAMKGIEFGKGFELARMHGSESNDNFRYDKNGNIYTTTNNCGGILGGITNGMPITFKVAVKPTPSIAQAQDTINLETKQNDTLEIKGRHDPCIVLRAVPVIEAITAVTILDLLS
ncbi:MAG: chorismate synthase [Ruminococcus sp.]